MEQVTIMPDNPRISLREHKELIHQVLYGNEKSSTAMEPKKNYFSNSFYHNSEAN